MSSAYILFLKSIIKNVAVHGGLIVFTLGVFGGLLNTIVFLTLRTFRQKSCVFYLIIMSIFNLGQLFTGLLPRILQYAYGSDGTDSSLFYCKFRLYFSHICVMISLTCFCLATVDQYFATSLRPCLQQLCRIQVARNLFLLFSLIWILHGIPYSIFSYHQVSKKTTCTMTDTIYLQYRTYFIVLILLGFLPFSLTIVFGLLAYNNLRRLSCITIPIARRKLDQQITIMVLVQIMVNFFTLLPYTIVNIISLNADNSSDSLYRTKVQLSSHITLILYYVYYANSFYIYICTSERYRRQLIYVLFQIPRTHWVARHRIIINQIKPR